MVFSTQSITILYVVVSLIAISILTYFLLICRNKDNFCTCQGMGIKRCPNPENLEYLYSSGKLTEYSPR